MILDVIADVVLLTPMLALMPRLISLVHVISLVWKLVLRAYPDSRRLSNLRINIIRRLVKFLCKALLDLQTRLVLSYQLVLALLNKFTYLYSLL